MVVAAMMVAVFPGRRDRMHGTSECREVRTAGQQQMVWQRQENFPFEMFERVFGETSTCSENIPDLF